MYKNREIYDIACKSKALTCLKMLFVRRLVYINYLIICYSYCFIQVIYSDDDNNNNNNNNNDNINNYSNVLLAF